MVEKGEIGKLFQLPLDKTPSVVHDLLGEMD